MLISFSVKLSKFISAKQGLVIYNYIISKQKPNMEDDFDREIRATQIQFLTQDYDQAQQWIEKLLKNKNWKLEDVLKGVKQHPLLKDYDRFANELFSSKSEIVIEMIEWVFTPKRIIARKQLEPYPKVRYFQPYLCKQIIENNISFYENMYKAARNQSIPITLWFHFLTVQPIDECIMPTILCYFKDIFVPFISQDYHCYANLNLSYDLKQSNDQPQNTILKLFSQSLIKTLLEYCYYEEIFYFLYKLILISLQQQVESQRAISILRKLYERVKQDDLIVKNFNNLMKQLLQNIMNDRLRRGNVLIQMLSQTEICKSSVTRIVNSELCQNPQVTKNENIEQEQQKIQYHLSFLSKYINIYRKIIQQQPIRSPKTEQQIIEDLSMITPKDQEKQKIELQKSILSIMQKQIAYILSNIHNMCKLIEHQQFRRLMLANEQQIRPITFCKWEFLKLLLQCLQITKLNPKVLVLNMNQIAIFPLIIRYLIENRWNNHVHHLLEQIANELITNNYNFFREKNIQKNKIADCFLGNLSRQFNNKQYWFLNTGNTTPQGNLHSIYKISKTIAYELNSNDSLLTVWKDFQPWKKLIVKDLKKYQDGLKFGLIPIDEQQAPNRQDSAQVRIDEAETISKLLARINFAEATKWPIKQTRKLKIGSQLSKTPNRGSFFYKYHDYMTQSQNQTHFNEKQDENQVFRLSSYPILKKSSSEQQFSRKRKQDRQQFKLCKKQLFENIKHSNLQYIKEQQQNKVEMSQQKISDNAKNKP